MNYYLQIDNERKLKATNCETIDQFQNEKLLKREIKVTFTILLIVLLFVITWTPIHLIAMFFETPDHFNVFMLAVILAHSNSLIHPFLYAYRIEDYKSAIHNLWCFRFLKGN